MENIVYKNFHYLYFSKPCFDIYSQVTFYIQNLQLLLIYNNKKRNEASAHSFFGVEEGTRTLKALTTRT